MEFKRDGHHFYFDISVDDFLCIHCLSTDSDKTPCKHAPKKRVKKEKP